jgi:hypothetical protein
LSTWGRNCKTIAAKRIRKRKRKRKNCKWEILKIKSIGTGGTVAREEKRRERGRGTAKAREAFI